MAICTVQLIFVHLIFATWAIDDNINALTTKISRSTVACNYYSIILTCAVYELINHM